MAPALPAGLDLDPATGEITGTPSAEQAETEHTVTFTLTGNYSGTATASITVTVTADARAPWVESLVYDTASVFVEVKGGAVAGEVTIAPPVLTQKTDVTSPITAEYSSVENRAAVDSSTGEITISAGAVLSDIDGNDFTFNIKVIDSGGAYADFQETVTVNLQKVNSITFGTPPALTYGDGPQMLTSPAVDAVNGADTTVTYSTSDAAVADVDSGTGELTIAAAGEVTITATSTFDTSVEGEQTLTIAQKDINALTNLTFGDLTAYAGIEFSGAITVSGLIGSDTMAEALRFEPIITGTVQVAEDGALTIPVQSNTANHDTVHDITVNGTGSYTGSKVIQVTLKVLDSSFSYASDITTVHGTEGQSPAPVWTNPPAGTIEYSLEGSPQGVSVDGATGVVTVGTAADVRNTAQITVKATDAEAKEYSASLEVTVTAKDIATVTGFSISVDDKTATAKSTDSTHSAVIGGTLTATTDYTLQITDSSNNVPGFMSIDADGDITIADSIAVSDGGTYTVTAAGTGSYSGMISDTFTLSVAPKDIATVQGFSISVGDKTATAKSTDSHSAVIAGDTLTATTDYTLEITDSSNNVPGFMSIDANGDIAINDSIAVSDGGTYTVTAAGTGSYSGTTSADFTLTVNSIDIATVAGFSISVDDKTATAKSTDSHNAVIGGTLTATTDYTLQITDSSNNVPGFMSIDADGDITIADSIAVSDGGTYTVTAAGTGNYSGTTNADFTLTVEPKDIAAVTGFSISVDDKTATAKSTDSHNAVIGGTLTATTDYTLEITDSSNNVPGFMSIDANGDIAINDSIAVSDGGTYTVTAAGTGSYSGTTSADFTLTVNSIDIATVAGFSISVDAQTAPRLQESTFSVTINNAGLTAGTDYGLSIEKGGVAVDAVSIDNDGLVSIADTIDIGDTGTYTVKAAGTTNYTGETTVDFVLEVVYSVGGTGPAGGEIFYVNPNTGDEWTYLEAALQDITLTGKVRWGGAGTEIGTGTDIGSGKTNTAAIVAALGNNGGENYAAKICSEHTVDHNGVVYDDWFLPSKDELYELYEQKNSVGSFASEYYWSSSEISSANAWGQGFADGVQNDYSKYHGVFNVRAVRAF